jgi:TPR repeat protein
VGEAAVRLAQLYERSGSGATADTPGTFDSQAWEWYQRAAEAGQPEALARLAEREEAQAAESETPAQRDPVLLDAFAHYAAAVAHAMDEGWPEALWRNWRYRRASLARALERDGEMDAVAERYRPWADFAGCRTGPAGKERAHPDAFCPKD